MKKPITLKVFEGYPHGFLNLAAFPSFGKELQPGVKQASTWMNEVFTGKKE